MRKHRSERFKTSAASKQELILQDHFTKEEEALDRLFEEEQILIEMQRQAFERAE